MTGVYLKMDLRGRGAEKKIHVNLGKAGGQAI